MAEKDIDIFVNTFRENDKILVSNKIYKLISSSKFLVSPDEIDTTKGDSLTLLKNAAYSDLNSKYWVWKNWPLKKYVGFVHYRKYFTFMDNVPDFDEVFQTYDIAVPYFFRYGSWTIREQYEVCHNVKNLDLFTDLFEEKYHDKSFRKYLSTSHLLVPLNMFIMKAEDYRNWCTLLFDVADLFNEHEGLTDEKSYIDYAHDHFEDFQMHGRLSKRSETAEYQSRMIGYMAERLFSWYVFENYKPEKIQMYHVKEYSMDKVTK